MEHFRIDQIRFNIPKFLGSELDNVQTVLNHGKFAANGNFAEACEKRLQELTGAPKAMIVHSCTAALEMAAILCDLGPGDEVILPSFTFVSTANAIVLRGAVPVFVDVDPQTLNIDPQAVRRAVTDRSKAIFCVHYAGVPAEMDALIDIARKHDLILVEDAAQALGAQYRGRPCGSLGDMATFSFHETKNLTSGEGGALTINRAEFAERADIIRDKGTNRAKFLRGAVDKYTWVDIGSSYSPSELTAAVLLAQLEQIDEINADRRNTILTYRTAFADLAREGRIGLLSDPAHCDGNGHLFCLLLRDMEDQKNFIAHMRDQGIETPFHYVPLHSSPAGRKYGRAADEMGVTEHASPRLVRLPLYYDMGPAVERVIATSRDYLLRKAP